MDMLNDMRADRDRLMLEFDIVKGRIVKAEADNDMQKWAELNIRRQILISLLVYIESKVEKMPYG